MPCGDGTGRDAEDRGVSKDERGEGAEQCTRGRADVHCTPLQSKATTNQPNQPTKFQVSKSYVGHDSQRT